MILDLIIAAILSTAPVEPPPGTPWLKEYSFKQAQSQMFDYVYSTYYFGEKCKDIIATTTASYHDGKLHIDSRLEFKTKFKNSNGYQDAFIEYALVFRLSDLKLLERRKIAENAPQYRYRERSESDVDEFEYYDDMERTQDDDVNE
jgi:hypothetical protein